jgi:hypothetical protein
MILFSQATFLYPALDACFQGDSLVMGVEDHLSKVVK